MRNLQYSKLTIASLVTRWSFLVSNYLQAPPPLESREPRNIVLSKFCSEIDRKFDIGLIACISVTLDHIGCLKYPSCCLVSPVFVDCSILIGEKCPLMHQSELLMVIIELYFQQNYDCSAKDQCLNMLCSQQVLNFLEMGRHLHVLQDIHLISITCALMIGTLLKLL